MSSHYPDSGWIDEYLHMDLDFENPGDSHVAMIDPWRQHRGPLDPTSSPSSPYSPALSQISSPMTPQDSPTVTRQLKNFGDLALDNEPSGISPKSTGSPSHQLPLFENNNASRVDNLQLLGPSITRRSQAMSTDNFPGEQHKSMIRPDKHGLEHRFAPPKSQGRHRLTNPHVPPIPTSPNIPEDSLLDLSDIAEFPPFDPEFCYIYDYKPTQTDIANATAANEIFSAVNDGSFAVGIPSHLAVPQFDSPLRLPLTGPYESQLDCFLQQAPPPPVKQVAGSSGSKDSDSLAKVLKCYYQHFKHSQPFLQKLDQKFKKEVGSYKTVKASLSKRKEEGHWVCPLGCTNFTRKQNLKHHLQSHLMIRDFGCDCGASFNALSGLKRHQNKCRTFKSSTSAAN